MEYWAIFHRFSADPSLGDLTDTQRITTGEAQDSVLATIRQLREGNIKSLGGLRFRDISISQPEPGTDGLRESVVSYCLDRKEVTNVDADTGDPLENTGPLSWRESATMVEGLDSRWRVAAIRSGSDSC